MPIRAAGCKMYPVFRMARNARRNGPGLLLENLTDLEKQPMRNPCPATCTGLSRLDGR
ncbi:uncharacterized protein BDV14DRAFT_166749 [Aspergillus stella-maris]|uniref:uncharacterized protein n=1 Tax=Aspergillus stella-maris TaxID=1810926 RepID=UPI003CCCC16A